MAHDLTEALVTALPDDGSPIDEAELIGRLAERGAASEHPSIADAYIEARDRALAAGRIRREPSGQLRRATADSAGETRAAVCANTQPSPETGPGAIRISPQGETLVIELGGDWVIDHVQRLADEIERTHQRLSQHTRIRVAGEGLGRVDTSGAWMLQKLRRAAGAGGRSVETTGLREQDFRLVEQISDVGSEGPQCEGVRCYTIADSLIRLGVGLHRGGSHLLEALTFFGRLFTTATRCLGRPARMRVPAIVANMERAGIQAIPIVALLAFLMAIVMAYQGATQLERFGAEIFTVKLTAVTMLREMGVVLTAVLVAGRSGSAFAAEVGVMKVNEEIDAMQTMGLDPFEVLVLPRVMALVLMVPLLTLIADFAGLAGTALTASLILEMPLDALMVDIGGNLTPVNFWSGMIKAPVFGFLIGTTATFWGLKVGGSADSVGRMTTISVVQSIFLVILADAVFTVLLIQLGL